MARHYTVDDLLYLMQRLRDPETGCRWDLKQSFNSIAKHTLEEVYEVIDSIEHNNLPHLGEELGDLLFQIIFYILQEHSRMQQKFGKLTIFLVIKN